MNITPIRTRVFRENEDLIAFIRRYIPRVRERSVVVVTSKIVALSEGRVEMIETEKEREDLIRRESQWMIRTRWTWLTIRDNMVMQSAGIDRSNADGKTILLPRDSFESAEMIRKALMKINKVKRLGVLITDSRLFPLRAGIVGVALGYAGFKGVLDYRGTKDIFGRVLKFSRTDVADSFATAAVVTMGEGAEQRPLALITDAPVQFTNRVNRQELVMDFRDDAYAPLFQSLNRIRLKRIPHGRHTK